MIQTPSSSSGIESKYHMFGSRLKATREALGIDYKEAAAQLRLHDTIILMLESGNFKADLPLLFIRGYVRNYSKFLSIPEPEVKAALELLQPIATGSIEPVHKPTAIPQPRNAAVKKSEPKRTFSFNIPKFFSIAITLIVIGMISFWILNSNTLTDVIQTIQPPDPAPKSIVNTPPRVQTSLASIKPTTPETASFQLTETPILSWLSNIACLLLILFLGMRSAPLVTTKMRMGVQASTRPTLVLSATRSPGIIHHLFSALKSHQTFVFFSFIIISSIVGVAINWQHKQTKHSSSNHQPAYTQTKANTVEEAPFNPEYNPETLDTMDVNAALMTQFKINALQALVNQLDAYQQTADELAYTLTDPSTPLGELAAKYKKRSRRTTPAYLSYPNNEPASEPPINTLE